jgi:hypothetical protein
MRARWLPLLALALAGCSGAGVGAITTRPEALPGVTAGLAGGFNIQTRSGLTLQTDLPVGGLVETDSKAITPTAASPGDPVEGVLLVADPNGGSPVVEELTAEDFDPRTGALLRPLDLPSGTVRDLAIFLRDGNGKLVGSAYQKGVKADGAPPKLEITWNREIPQLLGAADGLKVSDGIVIKLTTLNLQTGMANAQPGVDHVDVELSGEAYGDGQEVAAIGSFKAPQLLAYTWSPGKPAGSFLPDKLHDGDEPRGFTLTSKTYSVDGRLVGEDRLKLAVVGTAAVSVNFAPPAGPVSGQRIVEP